MPPAHIVPGAEFEANCIIDAHRLKSKGFMQTDTAVIGQRNAGVEIVKSLPVQEAEEGRIQAAPDAGAMHLGMDIDGDIDRPLIGGPRPMLARIDITENITLACADEPGECEQSLRNAPLHLGHSGWLDLE